jgi:predicted ABC-type ATPase
MSALLDQRPIVVALAGPNGAGKSTFYEVHMRASGLRFVNADELARELGIDAYRAAEAAERMRRDLIAAHESFVFETVFSDLQQHKIAFLREAAQHGYAVVLCFIGLDSAELSDERVALRALTGGHDVPREKLLARYPRSLANLAHALRELPFVRVFDNSVFGMPHRQIAELAHGRLVQLGLPVPGWFAPLLDGVLERQQVYTLERAELVEEREVFTLRGRDQHALVLDRPFSIVKLTVGERVRLELDHGALLLARVDRETEGQRLDT